MHWVWAFVLVFMVWIIIRKSSKISALKEQIKFRDKKIKKLNNDNHDLFIRLDFFESKTPSKPQSKKSTGVGWEEAQYLQERKIESKYFHPKLDVIDTSNFFFNKKVVITGLFDQFPDRNDLAKLFWEAGADIDIGVGKNTQYLIVGSDYGPKKTSNALKFGAEMIDQSKLGDYFHID